MMFVATLYLDDGCGLYLSVGETEEEARVTIELGWRERAKKYPAQAPWEDIGKELRVSAVPRGVIYATGQHINDGTEYLYDGDPHEEPGEMFAAVRS
jgi:hypothetical protein